MRTQQKKLPSELGKLEEEAYIAEVPAIPHETIVFLRFLLGQLQPERILGIGTAIGFSSSVMTTTIGENARVTTIDRLDITIEEIKKNYEHLGLTDKMTLLEGQAADILPELSGPYDFIFISSAKSKYIEFLPECLHLLRKGGVLMVGDIFQGESILLPDEGIPRDKQVIHHELNEFLRVVTDHPDLTSTILLSDGGMILVTKESETIES